MIMLGGYAKTEGSSEEEATSATEKTISLKEQLKSQQQVSWQLCLFRKLAATLQRYALKLKTGSTSHL